MLCSLQFTLIQQGADFDRNRLSLPSSESMAYGKGRQLLKIQNSPLENMREQPRKARGPSLPLQIESLKILMKKPFIYSCPTKACITDQINNDVYIL